MASRHVRWNALIRAAFFAMLSGCQTLQGSRPVTVQVRDAETKAAISGAGVLISYPLARAFYEPSRSSAKTAADGLARLTAVPSEDALILLETKAPGYLAEM